MRFVWEGMGRSDGAEDDDKNGGMILIKKSRVDGPSALRLSCVIHDTPAPETRQ